MSVDGGAGPWSADQLRLVAETRPRLVALAHRLARQFPVLDTADIVGLAEDRVLSDVHRFDESRGMSLYSFSYLSILRDVGRAAYARLNESARAAWNASRRRASALDAPTLEERINETADQKRERAHAMGVDVALAGGLAYECQVEAAASPEEEFIAKETRQRLSAVVASLGPDKVTLMRLLYVEDSTYEEVAKTLNLTVPQAKYAEKRVLETLRQQVGA
jgi:RNA polymerase sigma factor (sigma-70 family)